LVLALELKACLFSAKSYNAHVRVMQKDSGLRLVLFTWNPAHPGPPNHACASPITLQFLLQADRIPGFVHPIFVGAKSNLARQELAFPPLQSDLSSLT
jgi:hypothetical protein